MPEHREALHLGLTGEDQLRQLGVGLPEVEAATSWLNS
jgi:hypothetical protein